MKYAKPVLPIPKKCTNGASVVYHSFEMEKESITQIAIFRTPRKRKCGTNVTSGHWDYKKKTEIDVCISLISEGSKSHGRSFHVFPSRKALL